MHKKVKASLWVILFSALIVSSRLIPAWAVKFLKSAGVIDSLNCSKEPPSLINEFTGRIEPSDLAYSPSLDTLFLVSDNGKLFTFDMSSRKVKKKYKVQGKPDLEGVTIVPSRPKFAYLGQEYPASILEFNIESGEVERIWNFQSLLDENPVSGDEGADSNKGLESLVFVPQDSPAFTLKSSNSSTLFTFLIGRQADARVFVVDIPLLEMSAQPRAIFRGTFQPPGPGFDLSAMTIWRNKLWFLYDKGKTLHALDLKDLHLDANQGSNKTFSKDLQKFEPQSIGSLTFEIRGQEGIVFIEKNPSEVEVYISIDAPKKTGRKDLIYYPIRSFFGCHSSQGVRGIPFPTATTKNQDL